MIRPKFLSNKYTRLGSARASGLDLEERLAVADHHVVAAVLADLVPGAPVDRLEGRLVGVQDLQAVLVVLLKGAQPVGVGEEVDLRGAAPVAEWLEPGVLLAAKRVSGRALTTWRVCEAGSFPEGRCCAAWPA